jgi:hypothetical protein
MGYQDCLRTQLAKGCALRTNREVQSLNLRDKRNKPVYDVAGAVSDQELEAMVNLVNELKDETITWLQKQCVDDEHVGPLG